MLISTQASAKFVILANYELDDFEIDCFSQTPQVFIFTKNAGEMSIKLDSLKTCYEYSSTQQKEFYDCDTEKGLNRFVVDESKELVEHSFKVYSTDNCHEQKTDYIKDYFLSRGSL